MGLANMLLIVLACFNVMYSLKIIKDGIECEFPSTKRILKIAVWLTFLSSFSYIPLEAYYCYGVKLLDPQDMLWNTYEAVVHLCKLSFLLFVRYRKLEG